MGSDAEPGGEDAEPEPAMLLDIGSKDVLPLTVTKSALDVFKKLGAVSFVDTCRPAAHSGLFFNSLGDERIQHSNMQITL